MWRIIGSLLAQVAELYSDYSASSFSWGEEEMPECLKEER